MHSLHDLILIIHALGVDRHAPNRGLVVPPPPNDIGVEATIRMGQLDVALAHTLGTPAAIGAAGDPLLALAADIAVVIEAEVVRAAAGGDALVGRGDVEAVVGVRAGGGFEGAEAEDAGDEGPEVGDVGDDDGGRGFAGVPV